MRQYLAFLAKKYGDKLGLDLPYFIGNGFWVSIRLFFEILAGLALSVAFARLATQEMYGQYQFVLSVFALVSILSIPGLNTSIIKSAAEGKDGDYRSVVKTSFYWSFIGVPIIFLIGGYYYFIGSVSLGGAFMVAAIFFPFFYAPNTWYSFLQGKKRFDILAGFGIVQASVNAVATVGVVFLYRDSLIAVTLTYLVSYTFFNVLYYFSSLKYIENNKKDTEAVPYGFFLTRLNIIGTVANNIDKILIGIFLSPAELAVYSVGMLFTNQVQSLSKSLLWVISVKAIQQRILDARSYIRMFVLGIIVTIVCLLSFQFIIPILFSEKYSAAVFLSEISIVFFPFFVVSLLYDNENTFGVRKSVMLKNSIISPVLRIVLIIVALPLYGAVGLAFLSGFRYVLSPVTLYLLNLFERKKTLV